MILVSLRRSLLLMALSVVALYHAERTVGIAFRHHANDDHYQDRSNVNGKEILVHLHFETSQEAINHCNIQWQIVVLVAEKMGDDESAVVVISSSEWEDNPIILDGEAGHQIPPFNFSLSQDTEYSLRLSCIDHDVISLPVLTNVTIASNDHLFMSVDNLRLDLRVYSIPFKTENGPSAQLVQELRRLQGQQKKENTSPPERLSDRLDY